MNLGEWNSAIIKSISLTAFFVLVYAIYKIGLPLSLDALLGFGMFALLFVGVYLLFSVFGWFLVGFPAHWLICKYSNGSYFFYIVAALLFTVAVYFFTGVYEISFLYGFFALIQALLFKYYAYIQPKT